jgi:hypothetical protein
VAALGIKPTLSRIALDEAGQACHIHRPAADAATLDRARSLLEAAVAGM